MGSTAQDEVVEAKGSEDRYVIDGYQQIWCPRICDRTSAASGEFTLGQTNHSIKRVSAVGGTLKLKDELKLLFDVAARKQKQE